MFSFSHVLPSFAHSHAVLNHAIAALLLSLTSVCFAADSPAMPNNVTPISLDVFKSPTCGCCQQWVNHLTEQGFKPQTHDLDDVSPVKAEHQIAPQYRSCHTAVSPDGYVFEGHVPAAVMQRFLSEKPDALGLAVPSMPMGSPGMEMGDHFTPYDVLLLKRDGSSSVYAHIGSSAEQ